jgi:hypothetical protein
MTTNQLTVKIQDALGAVGFEAAVTTPGGQRFIYGTARSLVRVEPADEGGIVRVTTHGNGSDYKKDYPALMLEKHTDDALMLFFQTIIAFA